MSKRMLFLMLGLSVFAVAGVLGLMRCESERRKEWHKVCTKACKKKDEGVFGGAMKEVNNNIAECVCYADDRNFNIFVTGKSL